MGALKYYIKQIDNRSERRDRMQCNTGDIPIETDYADRKSIRKHCI
jgi:hypothetical protein